MRCVAARLCVALPQPAALRALGPDHESPIAWMIREKGVLRALVSAGHGQFNAADAAAIAAALRAAGFASPAAAQEPCPAAAGHRRLRRPAAVCQARGGGLSGHWESRFRARVLEADGWHRVLHVPVRC